MRIVCTVYFNIQVYQNYFIKTQKLIKDGRIDGWMDGRMDGRTDGRTDGRRMDW